MITFSRLPWLILAILTAAVVSFVAPTTARSASSEGVLVGRVAMVEGLLLRYVPDSKDWVAAVQDAPFGLDDALYADENTRAELSMPNRMRVRIGSSTQIQMIALRGDLTSLDIASGMARLINTGERGMFKVSTPFGYAVSEGSSTFDLYVGDGSVEVVALKGSVDFVQKTGEVRYTLSAGESPLISDGSRTTTGEAGTTYAEWNAWNASRDREWQQRLAAAGDSVKYLPEGLHDEAPVLDEYGNWERVRYKGQERHLWRPTRATPDYEPFTAGRWTVYHGDNVWMPDEPFGYVTHHYGGWVHTGSPGYWYWMPPVPYPVYQRRPSFQIAFSWFPGRVVWTYSSAHIGWVPLTPFEPYYAHRYWGPRTIVVRDVRRYHLRLRRFHHFRRAVIIDRRLLYDVHNYRPHLVRNLRRAELLRRYKAAPVLSSRILPGYASLRNRYSFRNVDVARLPALRAQERIERNRRLALRRNLANRQAIERQLRRARRGELARNIRLDRPRTSSTLVTREELRRAQRERAQETRSLQRERRVQREELRRQRETRRQRIQQDQARSQRIERQRREARERQRLQRQRREQREELRRQRETRRQRVQQDQARSQRIERQRREARERQRLQRQRREQREELRRQRETRRQRVQQDQARSQRIERQRREARERQRLQRERRAQREDLRRQRETRRQRLQQDNARSQRIERQRRERRQDLIGRSKAEHQRNIRRRQRQQ
ncbi:MAG: DUF6600 domain-containing protein [Syntrophobacteraceae bacterium]